jgi:hypothetical protein
MSNDTSMDVAFWLTGELIKRVIDYQGTAQRIFSHLAQMSVNYREPLRDLTHTTSFERFVRREHIYRQRLWSVSNEL